jgi:GNAT superfamily N-acetyltransferase
LAQTLEAAHEWCILQYTLSLIKWRPTVNAAAMPISGGGHALYTGPSPFTFVIGAGMQGPVSARQLDEIEAFYAERGSPVPIEICPYTHPSLQELVWARGYKPGEITAVLMRPLTPGEVFPVSAEGIQVHRGIADDCPRWVDIVAKLFFIEDPGPETRANMTALYRVPDSLSSLAYIRGELAGVAGGMLPPPGKPAPFFASCTLPAFRKHGVHSALLNHRLRRASEHGCPMAVVTTHPGSDSERNLHRHGFTTVYHKMTWVKRP